MQNNKLIVSISSGFIWRVLLVSMAVYFVYTIRFVILLFFLAVVVVSAAVPVVNRLERKRIPRTVSVIGLFLLFFIVLIYVVYLVIPVFLTELNLLGQNLPKYLEDLNQLFIRINRVTANYQFEINLSKFSQNIVDQITASTSDLFSNTLAFFGNIFNVFVVLSLSFYMLVKRDAVQSFVQTIVPEKHQLYAVDLTSRIQYKMGRWLIGQLILMMIIFVLDYAALLALGVPYALIIAILGGLLEVIPYIGPAIAIIPAALVGLTISPLVSILVIILYIFIQQMENYLITPMVMKRAVGLNPVAVILALLIGAEMAGLIGIIVSVPAATAIGVFVGDLMKNKQDEEISESENL